MNKLTVSLYKRWRKALLIKQNVNIFYRSIRDTSTSRRACQSPSEKAKNIYNACW